MVLMGERKFGEGGREGGQRQVFFGFGFWGGYAGGGSGIWNRTGEAKSGVCRPFFTVYLWCSLRICIHIHIYIHISFTLFLSSPLRSFHPSVSPCLTPHHPAHYPENKGGTVHPPAFLLVADRSCGVSSTSNTSPQHQHQHTGLATPPQDAKNPHPARARARGKCVSRGGSGDGAGTGTHASRWGLRAWANVWV